MLDLNVDVIDNETGEIYREGVLLASAQNLNLSKLEKYQPHP